jgi:hypothetical protein
MPFDEFDDVALPISDQAADFHVPAAGALLAFALGGTRRKPAKVRVLLFGQKDIGIVHVVPVIVAPIGGA